MHAAVYSISFLRDVAHKSRWDMPLKLTSTTKAKNVRELLLRPPARRPPEHHPDTPRRPAPEYGLLGCTNSQLRFTDHGLQSLFYFVDQCLANEEEEDTESDHGEDRKQNEHDEESDESNATQSSRLTPSCHVSASRSARSHEAKLVNLFNEHCAAS